MSDTAQTPKPERSIFIREEGEMAPRFLYLLALGMICCAAVLISVSSFVGWKAVDIPRAAPAYVVNFVVEKTDETVALVNVDTGDVLGSFRADQRSVVRDLIRRFDLMRTAGRKDLAAPYQVQMWDDGKMALSAPQVRFKIHLIGDKMQAPFRALISPKHEKAKG